MLTNTVVATKPTQMNSAVMMPFFSVTCPGPRWAIVPASTQAMTTSATKEMMKGAGDLFGSILPTAASHCFDRVM